MAYIIAQIFGILGIGTNMLIYFQKDGNKLLLFKLITDMLWTVNFLLLGAYSGAAVTFIAIIRGCVFLKQNKNNSKSQVLLLIFVFLSMISSVVTWKNAFSLLPATASIIAVYGFWKSNPKLSRILVIIISAFMLTYEIANCLTMSIINESLTVIAAIIAIIKYRYEYKKQPAESKATK